MEADYGVSCVNQARVNCQVLHQIQVPEITKHGNFDKDRLETSL